MLVFLHNQFSLVGNTDKEPPHVKFMLWSLITGGGTGKEFINSPAAKDSRVVSCMKAVTLTKNPACARESPIYSYTY